MTTFKTEPQLSRAFIDSANPQGDLGPEILIKIKPNRSGFYATGRNILFENNRQANP